MQYHHHALLVMFWLWNHLAYALLARTTAINKPLISLPAEGSTIVSGKQFTFTYTVSDACYEAYSPFSVLLLANPPSGLSPSGALMDADVLFSFGNYTAPNFGLPPLQDTSPPPTALTTPVLTGMEGSQVYLAVIETIMGCPPNGQTTYALTANRVIYGASE
ncbi:hypothetical protein NLI96_g4691 [Meripilus lineatus]|uniref:Uncharacterized protein n=1 Tax=Meripilus lineatus TaxID=2056292 RepID=A0AAD5YJN7_9APHY|nr:hypothetical protein NLI96_g4691 [Physisporinus lineatus]